MQERKARALATAAIHAGRGESYVAGAVVPPIFQSSTYIFGGEGSYHDVRYIRLSNTPSHQALADTLAALEGGEAALATASGMAAISAAVLTVLRSGDHLLAQRELYGGTHGFFAHELPRLGIEVTWIDVDRPDTWAAALRPTTRALYTETITNPLLRVVDLPALAAFAAEHGLVSLIDNTVASPVNFRPIEHGFDVVLHSATKYLNGHSDIVAGAVIGRADQVEQIRQRLNHLGGSIDPHACFLLQRGLKTLALRVRQHNESAQTIAAFLREHPRVAAVHYPGLPDHRDHARARALLRGCSGLVSFEIAGGRAAADALLRRVTIPAVAPSLGGAESLITIPATTSHAGLTPAERAEAGIAEGLIRLSVGLEDTGDLIDDLRAALAG